LSSLLGGADDPPGTTYELVVLEGADAGASYPLDRPQIQIGRGIPGATSEGGIELSDRSVSGKHALVSCEAGRISIEHLPSATNPTLVNGRRIKRKRVRDGDRIVLGLVVLELRARTPEKTTPPAFAPPDRVAPSAIETDPLNVQGALILRDGIDRLTGKRFPLTQPRTTIGRDDDCDIVLDIAAISRHHASLVFEQGQLVLVHESSVNPTHVNGMEINDRRQVFHGDQIRISERVTLEVLLEVERPAAPRPQVQDAKTNVVSRQAPDAEATHLTSPPQPRPASPGVSSGVDVSDAEQPTQVSMAALPADGTTDTVIDPHPDLAHGDAAAPDGSEVAATRVFELPDPEAFAGAEATRIAPAPAAATFSEGDATRIAPAPSPVASPPDLTRVADGGPRPDGDGEDGGDAKTVIRPSPVPELSDGERTIVRPSPVGDADATLIRPRPKTPGKTAPVAETVIVDPDEDGDEEGEDERS
jgi:pSer/pThr/pTyr-binding forkhead associated (FHA) protein